MISKTLSLFVLGMIATTVTGLGQTVVDPGTFGYGIELTGSGIGATNSGVTTLYALDTGGGNRLIPNGSSATLSTDWTSASTQTNPIFNLGNFALGGSLILNGGSELTYDGNTGDTVNVAYLNYAVYAIGSTGAFAPGINLPTDQTSVNGTVGDTRFASESAGVNLINGLGLGTYELVTYGYAGTANGANLYEGNGGANFGAVFTVVTTATSPEPSTWALMLVALGGLVVAARFRRHRI